MKRRKKKRGFKTYSPVGARIARLATNQVQLAGVLERTQQTISKKLRGECEITLRDLKRLAKHYGVGVGYFFGEQEAPASQNPAMFEFCDQMREWQAANKRTIPSQMKSTDPAIQMLELPALVSALFESIRKGQRTHGAELCVELAVYAMDIARNLAY